MRALKITLKILSGIIGLIVVAALIVWLFPNVIFTTSNVKWAFGKQSFVKFDPDFPKDFEINVRNSKFVKQKIQLKASDFCLKMTDGSVHACFKKIDLNTTLNFNKLSLMFDSIGPITIDAESIDYKTVAAKEKPKKNAKDKSVTYPELSDTFEIEPILINMPNIGLDLGKNKMSANLKLTGERKDQNSNYQLNLQTGVTSPRDPKDISLDLISQITPKYMFDGTLKAHVGSRGKKPNIDLTSTVSGDLRKATGELSGKVVAAHVAKMIPLVEVQKFKIIKNEKLTVEGDFNLEFLAGTLNDAKRSALPPPEFKTKFSGRIQAEQSKNKPIDFNLSINPIEQYGLTLSAKAKGDFETKTSALHLETFFVDLNISDFRKTVRGLKKTQFAIPAPINDLKGSIAFRLGEENIKPTKTNTYALPVSLNTNLKSRKQALVIESSGTVDLETSPFAGKLTYDVALNEIAVQMPDLNPTSKIPNIVGDKRFVHKKDKLKQSDIFVEEDEKKSEPSAFKIDLTVRTPKAPIRIYYKHFVPYAVMRIKTHITEGNPDFEVRLEPFTVSYLKRDAHVQRLYVKDDPKTKGVIVKGRFKITKADYNIFTDIYEENGKTYITLTSEPPLSEEDIVSLILFNELSTNLDATSSGSVQDTQAAMTKKAIGFLSFFVLASTPIESVNYDSTTGQYSARVKLPGGFTGTVGSDWDKSQEVGLRRRLGGKFVISATAGTDTEGQQRQETMVEWYHRY